MKEKAIQDSWDGKYRSSGVRKGSKRQLRALSVIEPLLPSEGDVLELGCGVNNLSPYISPDRYIGLDLSENALACLTPGVRKLHASAEEIPLDNDSIALVYEFAFLEHVENPERVLDEIDRVLRKGGVVCHATAWFCRPYPVIELNHKEWKDCSWVEKVKKACFRLRYSKAVRFAYVIPRRAWRELQAWRSKQKVALNYVRLEPNFESKLTDASATVCIDPVAVMTYYRSRDYEIIGGVSSLKRLLWRHQPVIARKR